MQTFGTPIPPDWLNTIQGDMPYHRYSELDGINAHGLMKVLESPAAFVASRTEPRKPPSSDMLNGILLETALLEPAVYAQTVSVRPQRVRDETATSITPARQEKIEAMLAGIRANPHAMEALKNVQVQPVAIWTDPATGLQCKGRLDAIATFAGGQRIVVDIKTARAAAASEFSRAAVNFRYGLQAAHYLAAGKATGAFDADIFLFIVVQNTAPYSCFIYEAGAKMLEHGRAWREHAMSLYADCRAASSWPGQPSFQTLELPRWAPWPEQQQAVADAQESEMSGLEDPPDLD